ncbi:MAG: TonB family protein [candidate division Zixibacteria bacterium]|nr:TonB family protein [candidate division Zixibacteria bacterium]
MRRLSFIIIILLITLICSTAAYAKYPPPEELPYSDDPVLLKPCVPDFPKFLDSGDLPVSVTIQTYISKKGKVKAARVVNGPLNKPKLEKLCIKSTKKIKFYPARLLFEPVPVWSEYRLTFNSDKTISAGDFTTISAIINQDTTKIGERSQSVLPDAMPVLKKPFSLVYPEDAYRNNINGEVILDIFVDHKGKIRAIDNMKCDNPGNGFEDAVTQAAFKSLHKPARYNGKPVACWVPTKVIFKDRQRPFVAPRYDNCPFDSQPEIYRDVAPVYPVKAQHIRKTGYVIIKAYVNYLGKVSNAHAIKCSNPGFGFEQAAINAANRCRYKPAKKDGVPAGCWISYRVNFEF